MLYANLYVHTYIYLTRIRVNLSFRAPEIKSVLNTLLLLLTIQTKHNDLQI